MIMNAARYLVIFEMLLLGANLKLMAGQVSRFGACPGYSG
jgi:hypothetical protein